MRFVPLILGITLLSSTALAQSGTERRRLRQLPVPAEVAGDFYPGDRWARVELELDALGAATSCRVLQSNETNRQQLWYLCRAFQASYRGEPLPEGADATTPRRIQRVSTLHGRLHDRVHPHRPKRD